MSAREIPGGKVFDEDTALTSLQGSAYYKIFLPEAAALKVSYTDHDEDGDAPAIFLRHGRDATNDVGIPDTPAVYTKYSLLEESKTMLQSLEEQMKSTVDTMTSVSIHPIWFELVVVCPR